ncbi:FixH family protein [Chitinivorax sp. PXF-14]|uniref:FixH family protein n=1 Tax=Chitinivorax sp. PXF-14 TaxID=3230488 RepID=UPI0034654B60
MNRKKQDKPWYRYNGPWLLMAGPAVVVVAGFLTAWLAVKSDDGLVTDDYYKQGKEINLDLARDTAASKLGARAHVMLGDNDRELRLTLDGNDALQRPRQLGLRLMHPTRAGLDQTLPLASLGGNLYQAQLPQAIHGRWYISVEAVEQKWRLTGKWDTDKDKAIILKAAANQ